MPDDDSSDLSSVDSLSPPPLEDDCEVQLKKQDGILKFFHKVPKQQAVAAAKSKSTSPPPPPKRAASPVHEYVLADNPDIAVGLFPIFIAWRRCCDARYRVRLRRGCASQKWVASEGELGLC